jgi:hypothetical protein
MCNVGGMRVMVWGRVKPFEHQQGRDVYAQRFMLLGGGGGGGGTVKFGCEVVDWRERGCDLPYKHNDVNARNM